MFAIEPFKLFDIKNSTSFVDLLYSKSFYKLLERKDFLVSAWIPAEECKVIDDCFFGKASFTLETERNSTVTLGHF